MSSLTGARAPVATANMKEKVPSGFKAGALQRFDPARMAIFNQLAGGAQQGLPGAMDFLSQLASGNPEMFEQLEKPALSQFSSLMGGLASRAGAAGQRKSGGYGLAQSTAAADFAERLQSQRLGLQQNAVNSLREMAMQLLGQEPYSRYLTEKGPSKFEKAMGIGLPILGAGLGAFGGPFGMAVGANVGSLAGSAFTGGGGGQNWQGISDLPTSWGS